MTDYKTQFVLRLQRVLGYEPDTETIDDQDWGAIAVLCNHAAVRIERLQAEIETLKNDDGGVEKTVSKSDGWCAILHRYNDNGVCVDCGHDEEDGLDIGDACSECGQEWTGTL